MSELRIGEYTFISMTGKIGGYSTYVSEKNRPGVDGHVLINEGKRGKVFQQQTKSTFFSEAAAQNAAEDYSKMVGTVTNLERVGYSIPQIAILDVETEVKKIGMATDGSSHIVEAVWQMRRIGESNG